MVDDPLSRTDMRIIAERDAGHWSVCWRKGDPATALGGSDPAMAVKRLCHLLGLDVKSISADYAGCRTDHLEFVVGDPCPDCGGIVSTRLRTARRVVGSGESPRLSDTTEKTNYEFSERVRIPI